MYTGLRIATCILKLISLIYAVDLSVYLLLERQTELFFSIGIFSLALIFFVFNVVNIRNWKNVFMISLIITFIIGLGIKGFTEGDHFLDFLLDLSNNRFDVLRIVSVFTIFFLMETFSFRLIDWLEGIPNDFGKETNILDAEE